MIIQLTSGRGPSECELAVGLFLTVLKSELKNYEILVCEEGRYNNSYKSVLIRTDFVDKNLNGVIQWICKSVYRSKCKRKNWFIGVNQIEEEQDSVYEVMHNSIVFMTFKSGGKGGQHVNKTESAVRAIHVPTGLIAVSSDERSQHLNKKTALDRLKKLLEENKNKQSSFYEEELNKKHDKLTRGNPIRVYEGSSFKRLD